MPARPARQPFRGDDFFACRVVGEAWSTRRVFEAKESLLVEDSVESRRGGSAPLPPLLPAAVVATPGSGNSDEFLAEAREKKQEAEAECSGKSCHPSLTANLLLYACRDT